VRVRRTQDDPYRRKTELGRDLLFRVDTRRTDTASRMLSGDLARSAGVESAPDARFSMHGVMGAVETEVGEAKRVALGPFVFENVPVAVAPKGWFNLGYPGDSVIACELLAQFLVRVDYEGRRLWLGRNPEAKLTPLVPPVEAAKESAE
jgi:hypothetical protein